MICLRRGYLLSCSSPALNSLLTATLTCHSAPVLSCPYLHNPALPVNKRNRYRHSQRGLLSNRINRSRTSGQLHLSDNSRLLTTLSAKEIVHRSPEKWQPYMKLMRLDRPIGRCCGYIYICQ